MYLLVIVIPETRWLCSSNWITTLLFSPKSGEPETIGSWRQRKEMLKYRFIIYNRWIKKDKTSAYCDDLVNVLLRRNV